MRALPSTTLNRLGRLALAPFCALLLMAGTSGAASKAASSAPPKEAKCPVCGMFVAKYPNWAASASYRDGSVTYFDGPKDLFAYYLNPKKFDPAKKRSDIVSLQVKDYYSLASIDATKAYFVTGSKVLGPMGKELVPFARQADAAGFSSDHQGRRVLRFPEVTLELLKTLE
ncbi:hypothetical protein GMLC_33680 [Geomonas limicola]|uniref:Nitrous oxide reductase accessory protein NosL n=1 Tax=Geomonas limicola TaxID=2740186 RepID=A0A6V8NFF8_9BACT|nr:nitrous oxide reductase accessory protein NosL [Geomonas limicola]GFO69789.1 hypothetical protein GMLC_33680 [Geomonas limicola]